MTPMKVRGTFEFEASFEDVTQGWTDDEKQLLRDGAEEAQDEAAAALMRLAERGVAVDNHCDIEICR